MAETKLTCAKCGKPVHVSDGKAARDCDCDAPIVANIKAHATGQASIT